MDSGFAFAQIELEVEGLNLTTATIGRADDQVLFLKHSGRL